MNDNLPDLTGDARVLLDALLMGFREKFAEAGLPFGTMTDAEYLSACHQLLNAGLIRIEADEENFRLAVKGVHYA